MTRKMSTEVAKMSDASTDIMFGSGGYHGDTFYEDMAVLRKLVERIDKLLPTLAPLDGMTIASAGWTLVTVEPTTGYPDFTMPPIPGLFGVPYSTEGV
jgi:hypothetical protein